MNKIDPALRAENIKKSRRAYYANNREKCLAYTRAWHAANPRRIDKHKRKYVGLPEPTRDIPNECECCGKPCPSGRRLALDHCYETNQFRGWLCMNCNTAIGKLGDDVEGLQRAITYLQRSHH